MNTKLDAMREGGKITARTLKQLLEKAKPGTKTKQLDLLAESLICEAGAEPSFKSVPGYSWTTCIDINDGVVHGVPHDREIKEGDVVSIDLGTFYRGFHTDAAWTILVGNVENDEAEKFLAVGETALKKAIDQARPGNRVGHISQAIEKEIVGAGYAVVRSLVGHGVGKKLHEKPQVPGFLSGPVESSPELKEGMCLAIEVIYAMGQSRVKVDDDDGWSVRTVDGSLAGLFEHTVAVTKNSSEILTG
jgi:methionyl aminopeptidase